LDYDTPCCNAIIMAHGTIKGRKRKTEVVRAKHFEEEDRGLTGCVAVTRCLRSHMQNTPGMGEMDGGNEIQETTWNEKSVRRPLSTALAFVVVWREEPRLPTAVDSKRCT